jgi:hypothetical protein
MTTLAKIEANRRNGQLSIGPRTVEGKAIVSRNATKHGIFAAVPVIPGESPEQWEAHRAGVVDSLSPVGLLEVNLGERVALLLWRLQRLARYEAETMAATLEEMEPPPLPPAEDPSDLDDPPVQQTRDEQLQKIRKELRDTRQILAEVAPARDFFYVWLESGTGGPLSFEVAESIFVAASDEVDAAEEISSDPPDFESKPFLRKLGLKGADPKRVEWTGELIYRGLNLYAACAQESVERFRQLVGARLGEWVEELTRKIQRLEGEETAIVWLLNGGKARKWQATRLLLGDGRDDRIVKYERHLHSLLTSTLHELERLQARREGEPVTPPAVADVNVTIDPGVG